MKKLILIIIPTVLILSSCDSKKEKVAEEEIKVTPPIAVEGIRVEQQELNRVIKSSGVIAGINEAYVVSETQGKILSAPFNLGQYVKKGQTLVQVENTIQKRAFEQAKKQKEVAEINLNITQKLFDEGNSSQMELTNAQNQFEGSAAGYEQAKKQLADTRVSAPIYGYIAQKESAIQTGNILAGASLVARIVNIAKLKVQLDLGEKEISMVEKGNDVELIVPAIGNEKFAGKVTAIAAGSNPANGSYPVEVEFKNNKKGSVKSGMSVKASILTEVSDSGFIIPSKALISKNEKEALFISVENKAQLRFISSGRKTNANSIIEEGLQEGMEVITSGVTNLSAGDTVAVTLIEISGEE